MVDSKVRMQQRLTTDASRTSETPRPGELVYVTDKERMYVGDQAATAGGILLGPQGGIAVEPVSGHVYGTQGNVLAGVSAVAPVGVIAWTPVWVERRATFDRYWVNITVTQAASKSFQQALYTDASGKPGTKIHSFAASVPTTGTGDHFTTLSQTLDRGWYWVGFQTDANTAQWLSYSTTGWVSPIGNPTGLRSLQWNQTVVYPTWPATATPGVSSSQQPLVGIRVA